MRWAAREGTRACLPWRCADGRDGGRHAWIQKFARVLEAVESLIIPLWGHNNMQIYGSVSTGLALKSSDIDVNVLVTSQASVEQQHQFLCSSTQHARAGDLRRHARADTPLPQMTLLPLSWATARKCSRKRTFRRRESPFSGWCAARHPARSASPPRRAMRRSIKAQALAAVFLSCPTCPGYERASPQPRQPADVACHAQFSNLSAMLIRA
jgi:hypothetical protein